MSSPDRPTAISCKRAAATVGVPAEADAHAVRSAFFRKLIAFDFVPPEAWNAAATRLGAALPLAQSGVETSAEYEKDDVEEFLACYWSLPPTDRKTRWLELDGRCRDAEVRAALLRVKEGLSVAVREHADAAMEAIARVARELYVLSPRASAIRRTAWGAELSAKADLESLGYEFQFAHPELCSLMPSLIQFLRETEAAPASNRRGVRFEEPKAGPVIVIPIDDANDESEPKPVSDAERERLEAESLRQALNTYERALRPDRNRSEPTRVSRRLWVVVGVVFAGSLAWVFFFPSAPKPRKESLFHFDDPPARTPSNWPNYDRRKTEPSLESLVAPKPPKLFTPEQVRQFQEYDPKSGKPEPAGYKLWRAVERSDDLGPSPPSRR